MALDGLFSQKFTGFSIFSLSFPKTSQVTQTNLQLFPFQLYTPSNYMIHQIFYSKTFPMGSAACQCCSQPCCHMNRVCWRHQCTLWTLINCLAGNIHTAAAAFLLPLGKTRAPRSISTCWKQMLMLWSAGAKLLIPTLLLRPSWALDHCNGKDILCI